MVIEVGALWGMSSEGMGNATWRSTVGSRVRWGDCCWCFVKLALLVRRRVDCVGSSVARGTGFADECTVAYISVITSIVGIN